jgi:hypothetical protein
VDGGSAQCMPGGTRLAQLGNAIANGVSPDWFARRRREIGRRPPARRPRWFAFKTTSTAESAAANGRNERAVAFVESRTDSEPIEPIMAIVSLRNPTAPSSSAVWRLSFCSPGPISCSAPVSGWR